YDTESGTWIGIVRSLGSFRSAAPTTVPVLLEQLKTATDPYLRYQIIESLGRLGTRAATAAAAIRTIAEDPNADSDSTVLADAALATVEGRSPDLATALGEQLVSQDQSVHETAARALRRLGPDALPAIPTLIGELKSGTDPRVMIIVCTILPNLHEQGDAALPALIELRARWPNG